MSRVAMCEVKFREKIAKNNKNTKYSGQQQK